MAVSRKKPSLPMPEFRPPQLATLVKRVPTGDDWLFEPKLDGYRCIAAVAGGEVKLWTRNGIDLGPRAPGIVTALKELTPGPVLLDGEVCAIDDKGRTSFSLLKELLGTDRLSFFVFDLLAQGGHDLARLPQLERKQVLEELLADMPEDSPIRYVGHVEGHGQEMLDAMCAGGHEGVIAKRADAPYRAGDRSEAWLKIKCVLRQEFVIVGWRDPEQGASDVRALFLATYEGDQLVYRGKVGTGFSDRERRRLHNLLKPLEQPEAAVAIPRAEKRHGRWLQPVMVAEIEYAELTPDGHLRHPSYQGLREDKAAGEVHLETTG